MPLVSAMNSPADSTFLIHGNWKLRAPNDAGAALPLAVVAGPLEVFLELDPQASSKPGPATPSSAAPPSSRPPLRRKVLRSTGSGMSPPWWLGCRLLPADCESATVGDRAATR